MSRLFSYAAALAVAAFFTIAPASPVLAQNTPGTALDVADVSSDVQLLFALAKMFNPATFGGNTTGWRLHDGYTYQYFINSRTYAGVKNGDVYLLGGAYGGNIVRAGSLDALLARLKEKTGANIITPSLGTLEFEYSVRAAVLPRQTLSFSSKLPTGWTLLPGEDWISVSQATGTTGDGSNVDISIDADAAALAPGLHTATILVRNEDDPSLSLHLRTTLYVTDPGVAVSNSVANLLDFDVTHVVSDVRQGRLYVSDRYSKRVYQVDAATGKTTRYFQFEYAPERMFITPNGERLYVALLKQPFAYWGGHDYAEKGAVGIINLSTEEKLGLIDVDIDPFDLVVTDAGKLIISSGSNQWTHIASYDVSSGMKTGFAGIRHQSRLSLHPSQEWVFSADTDVSPSDMDKYDISGEGIRSLGNSPYHGEHSVSGNLWITPNGRHIYTRGGDVFLASSMLFARTLISGDAISDVAFDALDNSAVILTESNKLQRYGMADFRFLMNLSSNLVDPQFVEIIDGDVIVVDFVNGEYVLKRF